MNCFAICEAQEEAKRREVAYETDAQLRDEEAKLELTKEQEDQLPFTSDTFHDQIDLLHPNIERPMELLRLVITFILYTSEITWPYPRLWA